MVGPLEGGVGDRAGDEGGEDGGGGAAPGPAPQGHGDGGAEVDVPAEHGRQSQCLGRSPLGQAESKALWKRKSLLETFESEFVTYSFFKVDKDISLSKASHTLQQTTKTNQTTKR